MLKRRRMLMGMEDFANGHGYVDLALPSGTMWSTEVLYCYCWGETTLRPNAYGTQVNDHVYGGDNGTKYNSTDNLTELEPSDDAASVNFGGAWVTPSWEQFRELFNYTTFVQNPQSYYVDLTSTINGATLRVSYGPVYEFWTRNSSILTPAPNVELTVAKYADILGRNIDDKSRDYVLNVLPCIANLKTKELDLSYTRPSGTLGANASYLWIYPAIDGAYILEDGPSSDFTFSCSDSSVTISANFANNTGTGTESWYIDLRFPRNTSASPKTRTVVVTYKGYARGVITFTQEGLGYSLVDSNCAALFHLNQSTKNEVSGSSPTASYLTYVTGYYGYAASLSRSSGGIANALSYSTNSSTKFTIDFWATAIYRDTQYNGIFTLQKNSTNLFGMNTKFDSSSSSTCKLFVDLFNGGTNYGDGTNYCTTLSKNMWYHIALTYDYSSSKGVVFVNGNKVKEYSAAMPTGTYTLRLLMKNNTTSGHPGRLDEFHMSNSILWTDDFTAPNGPWSIS